MATDGISIADPAARVQRLQFGGSIDIVSPESFCSHNRSSAHSRHYVAHIAGTQGVIDDKKVVKVDVEKVTGLRKLAYPSAQEYGEAGALVELKLKRELIDDTHWQILTSTAAPWLGLAPLHETSTLALALDLQQPIRVCPSSNIERSMTLFIARHL